MTVEAARNNARWCDAVCRAQGIPTVFTDDVWVALRRSPPYYPDAVTLTPDATAERALSRIDTSAGCSVKDSFATLDLAPHGFRVLFEAEWIRRDAPAEPARHTWSPVRDPAGFARWEIGDVFRPALLDEPGVTFFTGPGGAVIANRTGPVVGLSNLVADDDPDTAWAAAVEAIADRWPGVPIVGYEHGDDLAAAHRAGFTSTGVLRVWLKD
jgi:hypothetical protein